MDSAMTYLSLRAAYIRSEQRQMAGELTEEQAEEELQSSFDTLEASCDASVFHEAFVKFDDDMQALGFHLWLTDSCSFGPLLSWCASYFMSAEQRERVAQFAEELARATVVKTAIEKGVL